MKLLSPACHLTLIAIIAVLAANFSSGCKSYRLGHSSKLPFESIYIKPVTNDSFAPQAQALLSAQIRETFIRDGRTQLVSSEEDADAVLLVNIAEYDRRAAARQSQDTAIGANFDLTLTATVSLYNKNQGNHYFKERVIQETSNAFVNNPFAASTEPPTQDFLQSEYNAMPLLTRDLARKIADEVLSPWEPR